MKRMIVVVACIVGLMAMFACAANAATMEIEKSAVIGVDTTDWVKNLTLEKFDDNGGLYKLVGVRFELTGSVNGTIGMENLDRNVSRTLDVHLGALLTMTKGSDTLATRNLAVDKQYSLAVYDKNLDWAGTSGQIVTETVGGGTGVSYTPTDPLSYYIGPGTFDIKVAAIGNSQTTGSGNVASYYETRAEATAKVFYTYEAVPEPGALLALSSGLIGLAGFAVRRRK